MTQSKKKINVWMQIFFLIDLSNYCIAAHWKASTTPVLFVKYFGGNKTNKNWEFLFHAFDRTLKSQSINLHYNLLCLHLHQTHPLLPIIPLATFHWWSSLNSSCIDKVMEKLKWAHTKSLKIVNPNTETQMTSPTP